MDSRIRHVLDGLELAMRSETDGHHFYSMASRSVSDPQGKEVLEQLAGEELAHHRFLKAQYDSYRRTGQPDPGAGLGPRADLSGPSPIFSQAIRDRIGQAHYEMSALSIGIQLELASRRFYLERAEGSDDEAVTRFYRELADWESGHYQALLRQQEALKEDYWQAGGFAPF